MNRPVRSSVLVVEALRNLRSRLVLTSVAVLLSLAAGLLTVLVSAHDVTAIRAVWTRQVEEGRFVYVVSARGIGGIDASRCDQVNGWDGVVAAGGRLSSSPVYPVTAPGSRYELDQVTPGYLAILWPGGRDPAAGQVVVGPYAAENLGLRSQTHVNWAAGRPSGSSQIAPVAWVGETSSLRDDGADRHFFAVVPPTGRIDRCVVETDPGHATSVLAGLRSWFPSDEAVNPQTIADFSRAADPQVSLDTRASRWVWMTATAMVAGIALLVWSIRRTDFAVYRLLGARVDAILFMLVVETVVMVGVPLLLGVTLGLGTALPLVTDSLVLKIVTLDVARSVVSTALLPLGGILLVGFRSVFTTLKEG